MSPFGFWGLPAALLALLYCPGSGEKAPLQPEQATVKRGGPYKVNCTSSCPHPQIIGLETTLNKVELQKHAQWTEFLVLNVSQDTVMYCHFTCSGKQMSNTISVRVFHPPEQVLLELQPAWVTVGRPFTIVCSVPAVAPLEKLTLTLLHGKKPLHTQTFGSGKDDPQEATATHNATAHKEDGHHNFSCRAELDLRSLGGDVISNVSEARALQVYEPMQDNQMVLITVVSVLLFLFVTSVLLCFIFGQQWHQRRRRTYRVQEAWRILRRTWAQPT